MSIASGADAGQPPISQLSANACSFVAQVVRLEDGNEKRRRPYERGVNSIPAHAKVTGSEGPTRAGRATRTDAIRPSHLP